MLKQSVVFAVAALLISGGNASAQTPANNPRTGTPDRPPAATMLDANAPDPATTGQAPTTSEKIQPEMDSVGAPKPPPGAEKK